MLKIENTFLNYAISNLSEWNEEFFHEICINSGVRQEVGYMLFERGIESLAEIFLQRIDHYMQKIVCDALHALPIHIQVNNLLCERFKFMFDHRDVVLKILAMKCSLGFKLNHVTSVSNHIWNSVKHSSSGFDYYTRRMMLSCVYKNCISYFKNANITYEDMQSFIGDQLKFIGKITKLKHKVFHFNKH